VLRLATLGFAGALNFLKRALPIAIIIGLYLIIDDLMTAFQGGKSIIGDFYESLSGGRNLVEDLTMVWDVLVDTFKTVWSWMTKAWEITMQLSSAISNFVIDAIVDSFNAFIGALKDTYDFVMTVIDGIAELAGAIYSFTLDSITGAWDALVATLQAAREIIGNVFDVVGKLVGIIGGLAVGGLIAVWDGFTESLKASFKWLDSILEKLKVVGNIAGTVKEGIGNIGGKAVSAVGSAFDSTKDFLGFGKKDKPTSSLSSTAQMIPATSSVASTNNNTVNQEVKINVQSTDPVQAGNEEQAKLTATLQDGQNQTGAVAR